MNTNEVLELRLINDKIRKVIDSQEQEQALFPILNNYKSKVSEFELAAFYDNYFNEIMNSINRPEIREEVMQRYLMHFMKPYEEWWCTSATPEKEARLWHLLLAYSGNYRTVGMTIKDEIKEPLTSIILNNINQYTTIEEMVWLQMGDANLNLLSSLMATNRYVKDLRVRQNVTDEFYQMLKQNTTLTSISLENDNIGPEGMKKTGRCIEG
jgi:hypothetical protein